MPPAPLPEPLAAALAELEADSRSPRAGALLGRVLDLAAPLVRDGDPRALLEVAVRVLRAGREEDGEVREGRYLLALRRLLPDDALRRLAPLVLDVEAGAAAQELLGQAGPSATEALAERLAEAESMEVRRGYFDALRQVRSGAAALVYLLGDDRWYVARNAATLCGELAAEGAVPGLRRLLGHADQRVRRAAATALGKLGTGPARAALLDALADPAASVRLAAASGAGPVSAGGVAALIAAAEQEGDPDVRRALLHALGRCGTAAAVQALAQAAQPARGLFARRTTAARVAAVEGLRLARAPEARAALELLSRDGDRDVASAAAAALATIGAGREG